MSMLVSTSEGPVRKLAWHRARMAVSCADGKSPPLVREVDAPFARVGRHPEADIALPTAVGPALSLYLHAVEERVYCLNLEPSRWGRAGYSGWLDEATSARVRQCTINAWVLTPAQPHTPIQPDLRSHGSAGADAPEILIESDDGHRRAAYRLRRRLTLIGRQTPSKLRLDHSSVSDAHCILYWDGLSLWAVDLLSATGTILNGKRIDSSELQAGDVLQIGKYRLIWPSEQSVLLPRLAAWGVPGDDDKPASDIQLKSIEQAARTAEEERSQLEARAATLAEELELALARHRELAEQRAADAAAHEEERARWSNELTARDADRLSWEAERESWEQERSRLQNDFQARIAELTRAAVDAGSLAAEHADLLVRRQELEAALADSTARTTELQRQSEASSAEFAASLAEAAGRQQALEAESQSQLAELERLQHERHALESSAAEVRSRLEVLESERRGLEESHAAVRTEFAISQGQLREATIALEERRLAHERLQAEMAAAEAASADLSQSLVTIQAELAATKAERAATQEMLAASQRHGLAVAEELATAQRDLAAAQREIAAIHQEAAAVRDELAAQGDALAAERAAARLSAEQAISREASLADRATEAEQHARLADDRADQAELRLHEVQARLALLEARLETSLAAASDLQSQLSEAEAQKQAWQLRETEARSQVQQSLAALSELRRQAAQDEFDLVQAKQSLADEQSRSEQLRQQCSLAAQQLAVWRTRYDSQSASWAEEREQLLGRLATIGSAQSPAIDSPAFASDARTPVEQSLPFPGETVAEAAAVAPILSAAAAETSIATFPNDFIERPSFDGNPDEEEDPFDLLIELYADAAQPRKRKKILYVGAALAVAAIAAVAYYWESLRAAFAL